MEYDRKENRRLSYKNKNKKANKDIIFEKKDKNRVQKAFKHKKQEIEQEEIWEQWEDEVY